MTLKKILIAGYVFNGGATNPLFQFYNPINHQKGESMFEPFLNFAYI
jgi:hypothetical protein